MAEHPHRRAIAAGLAALVIGFVIALVVAGGDDDTPAPETAERPATTEAQTETETEAQTTSGPEATDTAFRPPPRRDLAAVQATVVLLVESAETRNAEGVCRALGQAPAGTSDDVAQDCADRAGVDLSALPSSDELSFEAVQASGNQGRATLANGDTITLRRAGGRWVVTGISR